MSEPGFYKWNDNELLYAPNAVYGPGYTLLAEYKDSYLYPIDGWGWFDYQLSAYLALSPRTINDIERTVATTEVPYQSEDNIGGLIKITNVSPGNTVLLRLVIEAKTKTLLTNWQVIVWNKEPTTSIIEDNKKFILSSDDTKNIAYIFNPIWVKVSDRQITREDVSIPFNNDIWLSVTTLKAWRAGNTDTIKVIVSTQ